MSNHYKEGYNIQIEVMDILKDKLTPEQFIGFCLGNIIKYSLRANFKGQKDSDIAKAAHYGTILQNYNIECKDKYQTELDNLLK